MTSYVPDRSYKGGRCRTRVRSGPQSVETLQPATALPTEKPAARRRFIRSPPAMAWHRTSRITPRPRSHPAGCSPLPPIALQESRGNDRADDDPLGLHHRPTPRRRSRVGDASLKRRSSRKSMVAGNPVATTSISLVIWAVVGRRAGTPRIGHRRRGIRDGRRRRGDGGGGSRIGEVRPGVPFR